jgi:hypothetical protein
MIKEALEFLKDSFVKSEHPFRLDVDTKGVTDRVVYRGEVLEYVKTPPRVACDVDSLNSLTDAVVRYGSINGGVSIWVRPNSVTVVLDDDEHRRNSLQFKPGLHGLFAVFCSLETKAMSHSALLQMLRHELHDAKRDEAFDLAIRKLKFSRNADTEVECRRTVDAMGTNVRAEVTGENEVPESVEFTFSAYPGRDFSRDVTIDCSVILMPDEAKIRISPKPGEMDRVRREAAESLRSAIENTTNDDANAIIVLGECNWS